MQTLTRILGGCTSYNTHVKNRRQWRFRVLPPSEPDDNIEICQILGDRAGRGRFVLDFSMPYFAIDGSDGKLPLHAIEWFVSRFDSQRQVESALECRSMCDELRLTNITLTAEVERLRAEVTYLRDELRRSMNQAVDLGKRIEELQSQDVKRVIKRTHTINIPKSKK